MIFKIHYNGSYEDEIIIKGESIEEIKETAFNECEKRGWETNSCWSERLSE